jgi:hypothetical protein
VFSVCIEMVCVVWRFVCRHAGKVHLSFIRAKNHIELFVRYKYCMYNCMSHLVGRASKHLVHA